MSRSKVYTPIGLTPDDYRRAIAWYVEHGDKATIFQHEKRLEIFGFLGEAAFYAMRPDSVRADQKSYDFMSNGKRVEVKTSTTPYPPKESFLMCIAKADMPDEYDVIACFYADTKSFDIYYLGYLYPQDLLGKFMPEGVEIPGGNKLRSACYRLQFSELR